MLTLSAAEIVGQQLKKGVIVVLEKSTIYPGVTEGIIAPILDLENESGLKCGADFKNGYSPKRINPGDEAYTLDKITKIVAGMDKLFCKQKPLPKNTMKRLVPLAKSDKKRKNPCKSVSQIEGGYTLYTIK